MKKLIFLFLLTVTGILKLSAQPDEEGSKDPALFTRMPNHYIYSYEDKDFDSFNFWFGSDKYQAVEGHHLTIIYSLKDNVSQSYSPLQVVRNYTNAIKKAGGQVLTEFEDGGMQYNILKLVKNGKEVWVQVEASENGTYKVNLVEKEAMAQDVVADAASLSNSLKQTGKVAIYGIYFDTGKSVLKPESDAAVAEIGKLMKSDPSLKIYVVGHTDNAGAYDSNIRLSMDRATAVVNALVTKQSVNVARLKACGNGPTAPVASNDTEEGKALNRRVELVKQ
ncbi:MAG TPA: OmpA family protein [Bacteroidales bacterium]|jgi:outer membrane protein OmpA-like peptidoglycan-associated protein|nr:OmpA family protein [Bacteroidales bacterium]